MNGDSLRGPRSSVVRTASAIAPKPPTPEAIIVAVRTRCASSAGCHPAWASASCAATSANSMKRSIFLRSLAGITRSGSYPATGSSASDGTSPPTETPVPSTTSSGKALMPDCPASSRRHASSTPQPSGPTRPMPVTTIRLRLPVLIMRTSCLSLLLRSHPRRCVARVLCLTACRACLYVGCGTASVRFSTSGRILNQIAYMAGRNTRVRIVPANVPPISV